MQYSAVSILSFLFSNSPLSSMSATLDLPNPLHPSFVDRLDEDFVKYYNKNIAIKPATHNIDLAEVRQNPKKFAWPWCKDYSDLPFVKDIKIASADGFEFTVRIYHPDSERFGSGPYPVHINFHGRACNLFFSPEHCLTCCLGGGFCFGDLTSEAEWCMVVRNEVGVIVVDVDYRLTPGKYSWMAIDVPNLIYNRICIWKRCRRCLGCSSMGDYYTSF
jgi:acetyl esterase/lipase